MPFIYGPNITRSVVVPEHTIEVLDDDAYWHLDWTGAEDPEGTFLYAKVAWPTLSDAKRQHAMQKTAVEAERKGAKIRRPRRTKVTA